MTHPYSGRPNYTNWMRSVVSVPYNQIDPVVSMPFRITPKDRVVTAGSCFAQHIARYLKKSGYNFFVTENPHPIVKRVADQANYGVFSARYGNIYTSRQLRQLFDRAFGRINPLEYFWEHGPGLFVDPFRPQIQPGGFHSIEELKADQAQHLIAVRRAFKLMDVFVFTLGLTETWQSINEGLVFPLAPGVAGGSYSPQKYSFVNFGVEDVINDMSYFISSVRRVNPSVKVILTVSPVPLMATAENRHVLCATTYSKSVLRVAADALSRNIPDVAYFPSYEIITGSPTAGQYFADNRRDVLETGVNHVMRLFFNHAADASSFAPPAAGDTPPQSLPPKKSLMKGRQAITNQLVKVLCDEEKLADLD